MNGGGSQRCCLQCFKQELLHIPLLWRHCSKSEAWDWINRLSFLDRRPHESLHLYTQRLIVIVQENNFYYLSSCFISLVSTCMIPSHHRPLREHCSRVLYEPSCAAEHCFILYQLYEIKDFSEHNVFWICGRLMCLTENCQKVARLLCLGPVSMSGSTCCQVLWF